MLPETVDCFPGRWGIKALGYSVSRGSIHLDWTETPASCLLRQDDFPIRAKEADTAVLSVYHSGK